MSSYKVSELGSGTVLIEKSDSLIANAIGSIASENFPKVFRNLIESFCDCDSMVVTRYPQSGGPLSIYHDLDELQAAITVEFYATGPYLLDPFYIALRNGISPGVHRLVDLTTESFYRSEYFRTFYRKIRIGDEAGIFVRETDESWIVVSLARKMRRTRFTPEDVVSLQTFIHTLSALVLKHWSSEHITERDMSAQLDQHLDSFAKDVLSPREAQIIHLVLRGHSSASAAAFLGIREGTVKVHRHNAYSKLGITSQAELFSLATRFVAEQ